MIRSVVPDLNVHTVSDSFMCYGSLPAINGYVQEQ